MPKYKTDYCVIRVLGNKVEVKNNNGKMSWFHISDMKKTDMITKLICQLPDYDAFGLNEINIGDLLQSNSVIQWLSQ